MSRPFEVWVENLLLPTFFREISRLHIMHISALLWTDFHQNRKDPIGKFHDGVIWLHLPEFISFFFSYLNFVIPEGCPKQKA